MDSLVGKRCLIVFNEDNKCKSIVALVTSSDEHFFQVEDNYGNQLLIGKSSIVKIKFGGGND